MSLITGLVYLAVAAVCGLVGSRMAGFSLRGVVVSTAVGFGGAWVATWFAGQMRLPPIYVLQFQGQAVAVVWAALGAAMFGGLASALTGRSRTGF